ncbi:pro-resilin-like [Scylla paramamosain]|uniref:pro-resilin-like n=1 Tax=Scylla paramamosain TaxID=85552 RepID=UPI003082DB51
MSLRVMLAACLVVVALAEHPSQYPPPPPAYGHPAPPKHPESPPKYTYNYGVADDYSGTNFGHSESRDGYKTEGSYTVNLPDGRKQIVTYVDNGDGLEAQVTYEGEAQYPDHPQPAYPAPHPAEPTHPEA